MVIDCRFLIFSLHCTKPFFETSLQSARSLLEKPLEVLNVTFECPQSIETGLVLPFINFNALPVIMFFLVWTKYLLFIQFGSGTQCLDRSILAHLFDGGLVVINTTADSLRAVGRILCFLVLGPKDGLVLLYGTASGMARSEPLKCNGRITENSFIATVFDAAYLRREGAHGEVSEGGDESAEPPGTKYNAPCDALPELTGRN